MTTDELLIVTAPESCIVVLAVFIAVKDNEIKSQLKIEGDEKLKKHQSTYLLCLLALPIPPLLLSFSLRLPLLLLQLTHWSRLPGPLSSRNL